jgi:ketosteroid isomerase-like protein
MSLGGGAVDFRHCVWDQLLGQALSCGKTRSLRAPGTESGSTTPGSRSRSEPAHRMMGLLGIHMQEWFTFLHEDVVLEFPYSPSIGFPSRISGKSNAVEHLTKILTLLQGLVFHDVEMTATVDPATVFVEYRSTATSSIGRPYQQIYAGKHRFMDGKWILFREYFDTKIVMDSMGFQGEVAMRISRSTLCAS